MKEYIKEILSDEQGRASSARWQSFIYLIIAVISSIFYVVFSLTETSMAAEACKTLVGVFALGQSVSGATAQIKSAVSLRKKD